jgi:hypothetical protein
MALPRVVFTRLLPAIWPFCQLTAVRPRRKVLLCVTQFQRLDIQRYSHGNVPLFVQQSIGGVSRQTLLVVEW